MSTKLSVKIDDVCPLIHYSGSWRVGSQVNDPYHSKYSDDGTFIITQSTQAYATVNFNGTRIEVFGGKRENHGTYTTSLDGNIKTASGESKEVELFRQTLFDSGPLENGPHSLVLRNAPETSNPSFSYFDIDYVVIETLVEGGRSVQLDDGDSAFTYGPESEWDASEQPVAGFSGGTRHLTSTARATSTLRFRGSAVDVFGLICPTCGQYTVALDGGTPVAYIAYNSYWTKPQTLLYMARGLEDGEHVVILTNVASTLNLDYAIVYGANPAGGSPPSNSTGGSPKSPPDSGSTGSPTSAHSVPVGAIVGAVVGGLALVMLGLVLVLYVRRKTRRLGQATDRSHPVLSINEMSTMLSPATQSTPTLSPFPFTSPFASGSINGETLPDYTSATQGAPSPGSPNVKQRKR